MHSYADTLHYGDPFGTVKCPTQTKQSVNNVHFINICLEAEEITSLHCVILSALLGLPNKDFGSN